MTRIRAKCPTSVSLPDREADPAGLAIPTLASASGGMSRRRTDRGCITTKAFGTATTSGSTASVVAEGFSELWASSVKDLADPNRGGSRIGEMQNGPIDWRLPMRERSIRSTRSTVPGRPVSLSRLPQASRCPLPRFRGVPAGRSVDRWRNPSLRRAVFLSQLRFNRFRAHARRDRAEPGSSGCP